VRLVGPRVLGDTDGGGSGLCLVRTVDSRHGVRGGVARVVYAAAPGCMLLLLVVAGYWSLVTGCSGASM
jgi:hypothetical protein